MKRTILALAAVVLLAGARLASAEPEQTKTRSGMQQSQKQQQTDLQRQNEQDLRDAPAQQQQQRQLQRPPGAIPNEPQSAAPGERNIPIERAANGGGAGLVVGGIFLALIVFILFRRGRHSDTPYNRP